MCVKTVRFTLLISLKSHRPQRGRVHACCGRGYFAGLKVTKRNKALH